MSQLYYTEQELLNKKHTDFLETETNFMCTYKDEPFKYYKKLFLLKPNEPDLLEIFVTIEQYLIIKDYLEHSMSRYMKEFNGFVFWSIKDYTDNLNYAQKHKLF